MGFRNIMLQSPGRLWVRRQQLVFDNGCETALPLEDINGVVIENQQIVITAAALASLAEAGVCVYFCDQKHLPSAVLTPYGKYSRPLKVLGAQLKATKPQYKRLVYRPEVDLYVADLEKMTTAEALTPKVKQGLFRLLNMDVLSDGQHCAVYFAIDRTVQSLANVLNGEENTLKLCSILPLEIHDYE